ncbi:hypothetical protein AB0P05_34975 [Streptomyces flaveolus]
MEIERRPDLRSRCQAALVAVHNAGSRDDPEFRTAMAEPRAVSL